MVEDVSWITEYLELFLLTILLYLELFLLTILLSIIHYLIVLILALDKSFTFIRKLEDPITALIVSSMNPAK